MWRRGFLTTIQAEPSAKEKNKQKEKRKRNLFTKNGNQASIKVSEKESPGMRGLFVAICEDGLQGRGLWTCRVHM